MWIVIGFSNPKYYFGWSLFFLKAHDDKWCGGKWVRYDNVCIDKDTLGDNVKMAAIIIQMLVVAVLAAFIVTTFACCCHFCSKTKSEYKRSQVQGNSTRICPTSKQISSLPGQRTSLPDENVVNTDIVVQPPPAVYLTPPEQEDLPS